ncbi:synaptic vesicle membrane protein VAT-1 homolog-like [Oratosquilla oratoria]|uniref:synaptic vesicle membrane protein VAT-1 homolog-like n=1 Tax=Oratosquilla oratoria TaxID=337810 RepID=UPI003F769422
MTDTAEAAKSSTATAVEEEPKAKAAEAPSTEDKKDTGAEDKKKKEEAEEGGGKKEEESAKEEMRAVVLHGFGGLKSVKIVKRPQPALADGEVLIRVQLCGVNFQDLMVRQGVTEAPPKTPFVLGFECAGVVEAIADDVEDFKVGSRVVAIADHRAWAELVPVPSKFVYAVPDNMPLQEAAAITLSYAVAYILVHELAAIAPGQTILLHSAGGAVGQAVCALCRHAGNVTVIGVASKCKHDDIRSSVTHLIERGQDVPSEVRKLCPEGVDVVLDCQGGEECNRGYSILKPFGRYVLFGSSNIVTGETKSFFSVAKSWWQVDKVSPLRLHDDNKSIMGFNFRRFLHHQGGEEHVKRVLESVYELWKEGVAKPNIDSTFALEDVTEAMAKMHERRNVGKLLLDLSMEAKPKPTTPAKTKKEDKKETKEEAKDEKKENEKKDNDKKENEKKENEKKEEAAKEDTKEAKAAEEK